MLRSASLVFSTLLLSGCSYSYDIMASMSGGEVVFSANPQWGADCARHIFVGVVTPIGIKDEGVMWDQSVSHEDDCENTFPLVYGEPLKGRPNVYELAGQEAKIARSIGPKPLTVGVLYEVHATTGATGYGCGRFKINDDGEVQSFSCS